MRATAITLTKYDNHDAPTICEIVPSMKSVYIDAFGQVYKDHWAGPLEESFVQYFDDYFDKLEQSHNMLLVVAEKNGQVVGWILFLCSERSAIIDILCVDPSFQQQGVGKALVSSIKEYAPDVKSVAVVTQKINTMSPFFYERLGFVKTNFLYDDHSADEVQGYELIIEDSPNTGIYTCGVISHF